MIGLQESRSDNAGRGDNPAAEEYLRPEDLARLYRVDYSTVLRWRTLGVPCLAAPGGRLRLRMVRVGGLWRVPREAWGEFLGALNPGQGPEQLRPGEGGRRRGEAEAASRRLDAKGLGAGRRRKG